MLYELVFLAPMHLVRSAAFANARPIPSVRPSVCLSVWNIRSTAKTVRDRPIG